MTRLENRGISGKNCLECCEAERLQLEFDVRNLLGELLNGILDLRLKDAFEFQIALVPATSPRGPQVFPRPFRIVFVRVGAALAVGAIVIVTAVSLGSLIRQLAALDVITGIIQAMDHVFADSHCTRCIRKGLWRQSRPQVKELVTLRRRR